jgi:hypothetical protein
MMTSITKQDVGSSLKPHLESQLSQLVTYSEEKGIAIDDHLVKIMNYILVDAYPRRRHEEEKKTSEDLNV